MDQEQGIAREIFRTVRATEIPALTGENAPHLHAHAARPGETFFQWSRRHPVKGAAGDVFRCERRRSRSFLRQRPVFRRSNARGSTAFLPGCSPSAACSAAPGRPPLRRLATHPAHDPALAPRPAPPSRSPPRPPKSAGKRAASRPRWLTWPQQTCRAGSRKEPPRHHQHLRRGRAARQRAARSMPRSAPQRFRRSAALRYSSFFSAALWATRTTCSSANVGKISTDGSKSSAPPGSRLAPIATWITRKNTSGGSTPRWPPSSQAAPGAALPLPRGGGRRRLPRIKSLRAAFPRKVQTPFGARGGARAGVVAHSAPPTRPALASGEREGSNHAEFSPPAPTPRLRRRRCPSGSFRRISLSFGGRDRSRQSKPATARESVPTPDGGTTPLRRARCAEH